MLHFVKENFFKIDFSLKLRHGVKTPTKFFKLFNLSNTTCPTLGVGHFLFANFRIFGKLEIMILSDRDIKKAIREEGLEFTPRLKKEQIGPASIDLKLSPVFKVFHIEKQSLIDIKNGLPGDYMKEYKRRKSLYLKQKKPTEADTKNLF